MITYIIVRYAAGGFWRLCFDDDMSYALSRYQGKMIISIRMDMKDLIFLS